MTDTIKLTQMINMGNGHVSSAHALLNMILNRIYASQSNPDSHLWEYEELKEFLMGLIGHGFGVGDIVNFMVWPADVNNLNDLPQDFKVKT